jgi:hypothetical protein
MPAGELSVGEERVERDQGDVANDPAGEPVNAERAIHANWQTLPLPAARASIPIAREYTATEYARIAQGFIPRDMDDRWFIYLEGDTLALHRSWTGACIFLVRFAPAGEGYRIAEAWANRDPTQYRVTDVHADATHIARLIDLLLLKQAFLTPEWPTT